MTERERLAELIETAMYWGADTPEKIAERLIEEWRDRPALQGGGYGVCGFANKG